MHVQQGLGGLGSKCKFERDATGMGGIRVEVYILGVFNRDGVN